MNRIEFDIDGEVVAQGRPRFGKGKVYDPPKSRNYKEYVRLVANKHKPKQLIESEVSLQVLVYKSIPKSMPKYKRQKALEGSLRPTTKPDIDNLVKIIKDSLNGVIWHDDSQVVTLTASKFYSDRPRARVTVIYE